MNYKLLVVTTDGGDREDGNVYYARYYLVHDPLGKLPESTFKSTDLPNDQDVSDWVEQYGCTVSAQLPTSFYAVGS